MTILLSQILFDHCALADDATVLYETSGSSITSISDNVFSSTLSTDIEPITVEVEIFDTSATDGIQPMILEETLVQDVPLLDEFTTETHDHHNSNHCSGFMLFDDDFVTFSDSSGACDWGTDMSMNGEDW